MSTFLQQMNDFINSDIEKFLNGFSEIEKHKSVLLTTDYDEQLEDDGDCYHLEFPIDYEATIGDIDVELDDDGMLKIKYFFKRDNVSTSRVFYQTFPEDADPETISATIQGDEESKVFVLEIEKKKDN